MKQIQDELITKQQITDFFPSNSGKILFLTIGNDIGMREVLWQGVSEFNNDQVFVEDVIIDQKYRRLVFAGNRNIIQSEVRLLETKQNGKYKIDHEYLTCEHHQFIVSGLSLIETYEKTTFNLLLIGLGGGCFINFLIHNLKNLKSTELRITVVEIDPTMKRVAQEFFDFNKTKKQNIKVNVVIEDGLKYLDNLIKNPAEDLLDFIIFDVDSKNLNSGLSCPPKEFVEEACLKQVAKCLQPDGIFLLNLVARDEDIKFEIYQQLKNLFQTVFVVELEDDLNEILYITNSDHLKRLADFRSVQFEKSPFFIETNQMRETYKDFTKKVRSK